MFRQPPASTDTHYILILEQLLGFDLFVLFPVQCNNVRYNLYGVYTKVFIGAMSFIYTSPINMSTKTKYCMLRYRYIPIDQISEIKMIFSLVYFVIRVKTGWT